MTASDRRKLFVRWVVEYVKNESGTDQIQVLGYCVYDGETCTTLFEHVDKKVCEKVLEMILNDETKGNKC